MTNRSKSRSTRPGPERAVLVGVELRGQAQGWSLEGTLDELAALADTAGLVVVARTTQRLDRPTPATFIGSGKVDEVKNAVVDTSADVVLVDHELSPRQQRNLEKELDVKVLDRTALILDVFAQHARTREGMLQVELAQYEYRLPRLTRMWTHLARQAGGRAGGSSGGVGVRGPGETQLEIDRREIGRRIKHLKEQIHDLRGQRKLHRRRRRRAGLPVVALVGYTNAGKSTLINALTDADVYVADQLFATLDPTTRRVPLPSGRTALVTDTVGFMQKLPTQLIAAFRATLEEISEADLLLHVVDVNHPDVVLQAETVERELAELGLAERPMVVAANKIDLLTDSDAEATQLSTTDDLAGNESPTEHSGRPHSAGGGLEAVRDVYSDLVAISAFERIGLDELLAAVDIELQQQLETIRVLLPYSEGDLGNIIHTHGVIESETYDEAGTLIVARVPAYVLGSVEAYLVDDPDDDTSSGVGDGSSGVGDGSPGVGDGSSSGHPR